MAPDRSWRPPTPGILADELVFARIRRTRPAFVGAQKSVWVERLASRIFLRLRVHGRPILVGTSSHPAVGRLRYARLGSCYPRIADQCDVMVCTDGVAAFEVLVRRKALAHPDRMVGYRDHSRPLPVPRLPLGHSRFDTIGRGAANPACVVRIGLCGFGVGPHTERHHSFPPVRRQPKQSYAVRLWIRPSRGAEPFQILRACTGTANHRCRGSAGDRRCLR